MLGFFAKLSVRSKMAIAIAISVVLFSGFIYLISALMLLSSYRAIERNAVTQDVNRVEDAITNAGDQVLSKLRDWAQWDDSYNYALHPNAAFEEESFVYTALANLDINTMLFADTNGAFIGVRQVALPSGQPAPASSTVDALLADTRISVQPTLESAASGLISTSEGPMLFAARPLSNTDGTAPPSGTLLFARFLDEAKVKEIADVTHLPVEVFPYDAADLPTDVAAAKASITGKDDVIITPLAFDSVGGYAALHDFEGKPILMLRIVTHRPIFAQGQLAFYAFLAAGSVALIFFGLGIMFLLDQFLIGRFLRLQKEVDSISASADLSLRLSDEGADEVGRVGNAVNHLLDTVATARAAEAESGKRIASLQAELDTANRQMEKMKDFALARDLEAKKLQPPTA